MILLVGSHEQRGPCQPVGERNRPMLLTIDLRDGESARVGV